MPNSACSRDIFIESLIPAKELAEAAAEEDIICRKESASLLQHPPRGAASAVPPGHGLAVGATRLNAEGPGQTAG